MSYEREAVAENTSAIPSQPMPTMREERVIDPYRARSAKPPTPQPTAEPVETAPIEPAAKVGQSDKVETPASVKPEEPEAETVESVTLAPAAAALARKEQKFRAQQQELKLREEALERERAEIAELKDIKVKLAAKDYSGIEGLVKYDEYTNYLIEKENGSNPDKEAIKKIEAKLTDLEKTHQADIEKRFEAAVNERRKAVKNLVDTDKTFHRIKKAGQEEAVVQHILDTWEKDNVDLTPEDAAREVDQILKEKAEKWAELLKEEEELSQAAKSLPPLKTGIKTLTNNVTAAGDIKRPQKSFNGMSDAERYAEARRRAIEKMGKT